MRDKSLGILLMVLFGISGIAVLMLAWLWSTLEADRITGTFLGSAGLFVALMQVLMLRRSQGRTDDEPVPAKVQAEHKS